jgi:hypothetical protein
MPVFGIQRHYKTRLKNDGPRYAEFGLQHFGKLADGEADGQPTPLADGDNGDEDGIIRLANSVTVKVEIIRPGINIYLIDGWIDCNNNGTFDDDIDFIKSAGQNVQILGPREYSFNVPTPCDPRKFFSRFRLTWADGVNVTQNTLITPFGEFPPQNGLSHGEVEDYPGIPPDQVHIIGPVPNRVPVGGDGLIKATVQANFIGSPNQEIVFTNILGNFTFTSGTVSADGKQARLKTGNDGLATMTFKANGVGKSLVKATVTGTSLSVFSYFVIVAP